MMIVIMIHSKIALNEEALLEDCRSVPSIKTNSLPEGHEPTEGFIQRKEYTFTNDDDLVSLSSLGDELLAGGDSNQITSNIGMEEEEEQISPLYCYILF